MSDLPELHSRPLPSFDQWLRDNGDGTRGDGYQQFADLLRRQLVQGEPPHLSEDERAFYRLWMGLQIAIVELGNIEHQKGREAWQTIQMMPRALGAVSMYAIASVLIEETPYRSLMKVAVEEFRCGARNAADALERDRNAPEPPGEVPFQ